MRSIRLERLALASLLLGSMQLLNPAAVQAGAVHGRGFLNVGPWISKFTQSDSSNQVNVTSLVSAAVQGQVGIDFSLFFLEYNASWLVSAYSANPKARDASYFSALGANFGVSPPLVPLEGYIGIERGNYKLNGGVNPSYGGTGVKLGANLIFPIAGPHGPEVGIKAEYRRFFISGDEAGSFPAGFSSRAETYFLGMTFGVK